MSYALLLDGVNDYLTLTTQEDFTDTGEYLIEIKANIDAGTSNDIHSFLYLNLSNYFYYRISTQKMFWQFGGSSLTFDVPSSSVLGIDIIIYLKQTSAGEKTIEVVGTGESSAFAGLRTYSFDKFVRDSNWRFEGQLHYIKVYSDLAMTTRTRYWSPDDSSHAAGTVKLTEVDTGNDADGVNMPTDGSAWFDLSGGGGFQAAWAINANTIVQ